MKNSLFIVCLSLCLFGSAWSQTFVLKDGKSMEANGVKRTGDNISYQTDIGGGGRATLTIAVSSIDYVIFPDATLQELKKIQDLVFQGKCDDALTEIDLFLTEQDTFRDIPGNLISEATGQKIRALLKLNRFADAQPLLQEVIKANSDPDLVLEAKLAMAKQGAEKDPKTALDAYSDIIKQTSNSDILADAWLLKGQAYAALRDHSNAILAFMHVPAFYTNSSAMPAALLASAHELDAIGDEPSALLYLTDLVDKFPTAAETEKGKIEQRRIQNIINSTKKS